MGQKILGLLNKTVTTFNVGKIQIDATYWMVGVLLILLFMILFSLARIRYLYVNWNLGKSAVAFLFWGFILAVGIEGIFMLYGRTIFTDILGIENLPKPFSTILDVGRNRMVKVLGSQNTQKDPNYQAPTKSEQVYFMYSSLPEAEIEKFRKLICEP